MNTITPFLVTGRRIRELEQHLATVATTDPVRERLSGEHELLLRRQQDQIITAHQAGVGWDTIRWVLALHGQHADREPGTTEATPAEQLGALLRTYGPEQVWSAMDAARR